MNRQPAAAFFAAALLLAGAAASALPQRAGLSAAQQGALKAAIAAPSRTPANVAARPLSPSARDPLLLRRPARRTMWSRSGPAAAGIPRSWRPICAAAAAIITRRTSMGAHRQCGITPDDAANPAPYGHIRLAAFPACEPDRTPVPDGSADVVLTFRNVHNWQMGYRRNGQPYAEEAFRQMFRDAAAGRHARHRRASPAGKRRRRARADQRLCQGLDRPPARRGRRLPLRRRLRDQRQSPRHRRLAAGRLDAAADLSARRPGSRPLRGDRRERPDDAALRASPRSAARRR